MLSVEQSSEASVFVNPVWSQPKKAVACRALFFRDEEAGGYTVIARNLPGVVSEGDSFEEALKNIHEAFYEAIKSYEANHMDIPWGEVSQLPNEIPERQVNLMVELDA
jgi:predicted RNase H-like HicB family nuclease